jgi:hypothetical protein
VSIDENSRFDEGYGLRERATTLDVTQFQGMRLTERGGSLPFDGQTLSPWAEESNTDSGTVGADQEDHSRRLANSLMSSKAKKIVSQPNLVTFDSGVLPLDEDMPSSGILRPPRAKSEMRHITFAQTLPVGSILAEEETPSDRPIRASGMYNLGDDIEFEDVLPTPARKKAPPKRVHLKLPKTQQAKSVKSEKKPAISLPPPSRLPRMPQLMEKLRSSEWSDQNDAITELMLDADHFVDQIRSNLRDLLASILECAGSLRSALAKNALSCLEKWIGMKEIDFEGVSEMCAATLLTLVSSQKSKHFISELSGDCFRNLIDSISVDKAVDIVVNEYRRKHEDARAQIALAMSSLVFRMTDHSALLKALVALVKDKNPEVRKAARASVSGIRGKSRNFAQLLSNLSEEEKTVLMDASRG